MSQHDDISRRDFLKLAGAVAGGLILEGCLPPSRGVASPYPTGVHPTGVHPTGVPLAGVHAVGVRLTRRDAPRPGGHRAGQLL